MIAVPTLMKRAASVLLTLSLSLAGSVYAQQATVVKAFDTAKVEIQPTVAPPPPPPDDGEPLYNGAGIVTTSVPATMVANGVYDVRVVMRNNGTTTWSPDIGYTLASRNPDNNNTWGLNRVPSGYNIRPGQLYDFTFQVRAPSTPGTYAFNWGMLQQDVEWIGGSTTNVISVTALSSGGSPAPGVQASLIAIRMLLEDDGPDSSTAPGTPDGTPGGFDPPPANGANGTVTYIHTDGLGSPVVRTDTSGKLVSSMRYEPYGLQLSGLELSTYTMGFTGHVHDADTGFIYMQQRYYDSVLGRFLSVDPVITDMRSGEKFNRYFYSNDSPYTYIDPDGRDPASIAATAKTYIGDRGWGKPGWQGGIGWITEFKCNLFLNRVIYQSGDIPPLLNGRQATAGEIANKNLKIAGWEIVNDGTVKDGDIVAMGMDGDGYSGHTGIIVTFNGMPYTISANSHTGTVTWNDWGFRPGQNSTIRRYIPGQGHPEDPATKPKPPVDPSVPRAGRE